MITQRLSGLVLSSTLPSLWNFPKLFFKIIFWLKLSNFYMDYKHKKWIFDLFKFEKKIVTLCVNGMHSQKKIKKRYPQLYETNALTELYTGNIMVWLKTDTLKIIHWKILPLISKKAGRFEKLLGFARSHSIVRSGSVSLSCATIPHPSFFSKS